MGVHPRECACVSVSEGCRCAECENPWNGPRPSATFSWGSSPVSEGGEGVTGPSRSLCSLPGALLSSAWRRAHAPLGVQAAPDRILRGDPTGPHVWVREGQRWGFRDTRDYLLGDL